jgi:MYXO-CTERM domain-containing protein
VRRIALALFVGAATPALAHVHNVGMDLICSTTDSPPGLTLLPLLVLVAIGAVRAVLRQRK